MLLARISSMAKPSASSMAGSTASVKRFGSEVAQGHEAGFHHAGHQRRHDARHRNDALQTARFGLEQLADFCSGRLRNNSAVASFGMVPTPAMAKTLPSLVRIRMGASPPRPKCENSVTDAAKMARDARVDRIAAPVVHAHAGFGGVLAARRDGAVSAAHRLPQRMVDFAPRKLRIAQAGEREEENELFEVHER